MNVHPVADISRASIEKRDLDAVIRIVQPLKPKVILEIGTWKGYSAEVWSEAFHPKKLITIEKDSQFEDAVISDKDNHHYLWNTESTSQDTVSRVVGLLGEDQIDFLFIDGGHDYNTVRKDWELYGPLVMPGGIIAFHDVCYIHYDCQVPTLWEQLKRQYQYVEINLGLGSTGFGFLFNDRDQLTVGQKSKTL